MSLETVKQLYQDISTLAQTRAGESADVSMVTMFNANLAEAQRMYQHHAILSALTQAQNQVPIGDLLIRTGQLQAILQEAANSDRAQHTRRANQARRKQFGLG
jgi:hypothetical protein